MRARLVVLVSGEGTNLQALIDACADEGYGADVVEVGADRFDVTAAVVTGPERDRLYAEQATRYPGFAEYQEKTDRVIPVVELARS